MYSLVSHLVVDSDVEARIESEFLSIILSDS